MTDPLRERVSEIAAALRSTRLDPYATHPSMRSVLAFVEELPRDVRQIGYVVMGITFNTATQQIAGSLENAVAEHGRSDT